MVRLVALTLGSSLIFGSFGIPAFANDWTTIRIATEGAYPPFNMVEASGTIAGYDVDVSNELCRRMKADCKIVTQDWDGIIPALNAGKYDAIVAAMVDTPERSKAVAFTQPYALMRLSLMTAKDNSLAQVPASKDYVSLAGDLAAVQKAVDALKPQLKGKILGGQTATTQIDFFKTYFPDVEVREYKTSEAMILDLVSGRIDAVMDGMGYLGGVLSSPQGKDLMLVGPQFGGGLFGGDSRIALRKDNPDLVAKFNDALASSIADGTLAKLSMKWFSIDIAPK